VTLRWAAIYLMVGFALLATLAGCEHFRPGLAPDQVMPGRFETTGGGNVTIGCALLDVPEKGTDYEGDPHDFLLQADREALLMVIVHDGHTYILSGQQCGISTDWTRFPQKERPSE
jgi:hypothetical protein